MRTGHLERTAVAQHFLRIDFGFELEAVAIRLYAKVRIVLDSWRCLRTSDLRSSGRGWPAARHNARMQLRMPPLHAPCRTR